MSDMKSYTDLEQSKKLAGFLPLESADMCFNISQRSNMPPLMTPYSKFNEFFNMETPDFLIPCWGLVALFGLIPKYIKEHNVLRIDMDENTFAMWYDEIGYGVNLELPNIEMSEPVDTCVEMILKLHELNLL